MNKELDEKVKNHTLKLKDIVIGENHFGNPKFNPELLDCLIDNGIKPKQFWGEYNLDCLGDLKYHFNIFLSAYGRVRSKKKQKEANYGK